MSKWKMVKLGEVSDVVSGFAFDSKQFTDDSTAMPIIRIRDVVRGFTETYTTERYDKKYVVKKGDLLIGMDGEFNIAEWKSEPALLNQRVCKIFAGNVSIIEKYLLYFMPAALKSIEDKTPFVTVKHISVKQIKEIIIPLPPIEEQKRIADILDKASNLIDLRKQQLEKMDLLIKSKFIDMFGDPVTNPKGWEKRKLIEVCKEIVDCPHSTPKHEDRPTNYPSIRTTELKNGVIDWASMKYVNAEEYHSRTKILVPQVNDIIYGREGSYGEAVLLPDGYSFCLGQRVMLLRSNENICCPIFLWYLIRSPLVYNQAKAKNIGATVGHVNVKDIMQFRIFLPPICIQKRFADFVEQVEQQKAVMQQSLGKMETNYKALMQEYFG